jgi:hypothetical protein
MKTTKSERPIVRALRKAIKADSRTTRRLAHDAGIPAPVLSRFVQRKRGLNLDSAAAVAEVLGLELTSAKGGTSF